MSEPHDIESGSARGDPTSRRDMLKKAAIVGGLVWTLPVIESLTNAAHAGSAGPCGVYDCNQANGGLSPCQCPSPNGSPGFLVQRVDGSCVCATDIQVMQINELCPKGTVSVPSVHCGLEAPHSVCITECA